MSHCDIATSFCNLAPFKTPVPSYWKDILIFIILPIVMCIYCTIYWSRPFNESFCGSESHQHKVVPWCTRTYICALQWGKRRQGCSKTRTEPTKLNANNLKQTTKHDWLQMDNSTPAWVLLTLVNALIMILI